MRLRTIALIALVLGLSRLAFPSGPIPAKRTVQRTRPRPVRRAPVEKKLQPVPVISVPSVVYV